MPGSALGISVIEMIRPRIVEVDCLLYESQAHELRIEVDVGLRVRSDGRNMVYPRDSRVAAGGHACSLLEGSYQEAPETSATGEIGFVLAKNL